MSSMSGFNATSDVNRRLEIRDFQANPEQFSLFIQALINMSNAGKCPNCGQDRPPPCLCSLSVIERGIIKEAQGIVERLIMANKPEDWFGCDLASTQQRWRRAADEIRVPFWDRNLLVPPIPSDPKLTLIRPNGSPLIVENILVPLCDRLPSS